MVTEQDGYDLLENLTAEQEDEIQAILETEGGTLKDIARKLWKWMWKNIQ